ncbi:hypothetical protein MLD52_06035 [Puniceicoccaceae bacterium K14]|nr:hypothetical protein [Puniceicoccaceae bacterium K14]
MSDSTSLPTKPEELVERAIQDNRLAHGLLIYGQNLEQVEAFARALAAKLLGLELDDELEKKLSNHPDVFALRPAKKSRVIAVDDMRELIRNVQHTPQAGDRKVAFIHEVDRMNNATANAFLKTLEEPPLNTTLLLLTTKQHSLLATIRSRCQLFRIPTSLNSFNDERARDWVEKYKTWLKDLAQGGPGGKSSIPHFIVGLYGLIEQFSGIIETITKERWKEQSKSLPEDMADDERIAAESRISISIRQDFLNMIEVATESFARDALGNVDNTPAKLINSIHALEDAQGLLRLNMKVETMLESYLLNTLRAWTTK